MAVADTSPLGVAQREAAKRQEQIRAAQEMFTDAELDRREGGLKSAVEKYRTAFLATPNVPAAAPMRESIFKRYQQGAAAYAEELANGADGKAAESVLTQLMNDARDAGLPASRIDSSTRTLLARLKGDDYYNKAMTPQHLANVAEVEKRLIQANGAFEIGDLTQARKQFETVLNLDRTNTAARLGLEKVDRMVTEYEEVARNQTRAAMLRQVAEGWESPVPPATKGRGFEASVISAVGEREAAIREKLGRMVVKQVDFTETPLRDVVDYLTQIARDLDTAEPDPSKRGVNIVVDPRSVTNAGDVLARPVTLRMSNAPLESVLKYATEQAQMKYRIDAVAISIVPLSASDDKQLMTRTYRVPPGFISGTAGAAGGGAPGAPPDPFAQAPAGAPGGAGTLVKRIGAKEFLEQNGVSFPEGALASFNAVNSTLVVKNTPDNIQLIEALILASRESGAKQVRVEFKMIETTDRILNELGFDWLVGQFNLPGSGGIFAGGGTPGNTTGDRLAADFPFVAPGGVPLGQNPLTSALRMGRNAQTTSTIDDVINRDSPSTSGSTITPGVLSIAGAFTDPQFQVVLRALTQRTGNDLLCSASVVTKPGQRAIIKQVREFIYPTEYDPPEIPTSVGATVLGFTIVPATPAAFETRELGKILEVEPAIGADNLTVDLNLITDLSEFTGFINYGSPISDPGLGIPGSPTSVVVTENRILMPVFDAIKETTQVTIYDGQTLVVGGLIGESVNKVQDKVPLLGDAPGIGKLFRSEIDERNRRALVLFATVRIVDAAGVPVNELSRVGQNAAPAAAN